MSLNRANIPVSLYVHFPWCERKCPYCDFNSHEIKGSIDENEYIDLLLLDLQSDVEHFSETRSLQSIFMGGGTPSLFSAESINRLLDGIASIITLSPNVEVTLEANPGSSEAQKFLGFKQAGVNRISLGIQSFDDASLKAIGRIHNGSESRKAVECLQHAGFSNYNLDLMFGLPQQSIDQANADMQQALAFNPTHISCYQLTFEPNTLFYHQRPKRIDDDGLWTMQETLQQQLADAGYQQYEVSAYAHKNHTSKHNLNYWNYGDYYGIGAGAHSKVTTHDAQISRIWKRKNPRQYEQAAVNGFWGGQELVSRNDAVFEALLNGLRLKQGVSVTQVTERTGINPITELPKIDSLLQQELLCYANDTLYTSPKGFRYLDSVLEQLLPDS